MLRYDTPEKHQRSIRGLYRMVSGVDRNLGRILSELERLGIAEQTVVIFSSDHGMFYGGRGLSDCWLLHEESLRVPLLIYDPRVDCSRATCDQMVLNIDIAPTLLTLAGLPAPESYQGRSLVPLLGAATSSANTTSPILGYPKARGCALSNGSISATTKKSLHTKRFIISKPTPAKEQTSPPTQLQRGSSNL